MMFFISDHYRGLSGTTWTSANFPPGALASIHCTSTTARLVCDKLEIESKYIFPHGSKYAFTFHYVNYLSENKSFLLFFSSLLAKQEIDETFELDGCRITFIDANHCPGAAMVSKFDFLRTKFYHSFFLHRF